MSDRRYKAGYGRLKKFLLMIRDLILDSRRWYLTNILKMNLSPTCRFSLKANLDKTNPKGVHVGDETYLAFGTVIFAHDMSRGFHANTYIGDRCFIGANSIIMPGVRVGNQCIVGAGSVVTKDVHDCSIVAGNPARVIKEGIRTRAFGTLISD